MDFRAPSLRWGPGMTERSVRAYPTRFSIRLSPSSGGRQHLNVQRARPMLIRVFIPEATGVGTGRADAENNYDNDLLPASRSEPAGRGAGPRPGAHPDLRT